MELIKSYRGTLIEEVIEPYLAGLTSEPIESLETSIQSKLSSVLNFETQVSNVKLQNEFTTGEVYFQDEDGVNRAVQFSIIRN